MARQVTHASQIRGRILGIGWVVRRSNRGLVRQNVDAAQSAELCHSGRNVVVADQDVFVFFLDQLVARRNHNLNHVLASGQHRSSGTIRVVTGIGRCSQPPVRDAWLGFVVHPVQFVPAGFPVAGSIDVTPGNCTYHRTELAALVPVVHAVIALELGVVRQRSNSGSTMLRVVPIR